MSGQPGRRIPVEAKICIVCGGKVPHGRHKFGGAYCGEMCEKKVHGWSEQHIKQLEKISPEVNASTAFRPMALDPMIDIVTDSPVLIMSDLHCPLHDPIWTTRAIDIGIHFGADTCILNGDVLDLNAISKHVGSYYRRGQELEDDFAAAEVLIKHICKLFKRVYWLSGNHDHQRLIKVFHGEIQVQRLLKMVGEHDNLKITARSYLDVNSAVRVCHPRAYSRIRGSMAQKIAQRWQRSVVCGHLHHSSMTHSPCGKFQAVEVPGLQDTDVQDYIRNELTDNVEPANGCAVVFGTKVQVFDKFTIWKNYGMPEL